MSMTRIRAVHAAVVAMALVLFVSPACESSFDDEGSLTLDDLNGRTTPSASSSTNAPSSPSATTNSSSSNSPSSSSSSSTSPGSSTGGGSASSGGSSSGASTSPIGNIHWLDLDVSSWTVTTTLSAKISGDTIHMNYNKASVWPANPDVVANCWAIVNINGTWYAGTFEYLRPGQTSKPTGVLDGSLGNHFTKDPLASWRPHSGERFGLMVSGLCRGSARNVSQRSNICMVTWP